MTRHQLSGELFGDEGWMFTIGYDSATYLPTNDFQILGALAFDDETDTPVTRQ